VFESSRLMQFSDPKIFICPKDKLELKNTSQGLACNACGTVYKISGSCIEFLAVSDTFYEGTYVNEVKFQPKSTKWYHTWPVWLLVNGYCYKVCKLLPVGSRVLELGCAGGVALFGDRFEMIGLDVSRLSLHLASKKYSCCLYAKAENIPLSGESVDAVISSYFWEHITPDEKRKLLTECYRVLRPGGLLVFLFDVETSNPLIMFMKEKDFTLYQKEFLDHDGHVGYESIAVNRQTFENAGLQVLENFGMERFLQSTSVFIKMKKWGGLLSIFSKCAKVLQLRYLNYFYLAAVRLCDESIGRLLPESWSRILLSVARKPIQPSCNEIVKGSGSKKSV